MTDNKKFTVDIGFTVRVKVNAENVQDAISMALTQYDPKKVTMDREVVVFQEGQERPDIVALTRNRTRLR